MINGSVGIQINYKLQSDESEGRLKRKELLRCRRLVMNSLKVNFSCLALANEQLNPNICIKYGAQLDRVSSELRINTKVTLRHGGGGGEAISQPRIQQVTH